MPRRRNGLEHRRFVGLYDLYHSSCGNADGHGFHSGLDREESYYGDGSAGRPNAYKGRATFQRFLLHNNELKLSRVSLNTVDLVPIPLLLKQFNFQIGSSFKSHHEVCTSWLELNPILSIRTCSR